MKIALIAENCESIKKNFKEGGAIDVELAYTNLTQNRENLLKNTTEHVEKLVIVYNNLDTDIRSEMLVLKTLVSEDTFFEFDEVVLFVRGSEEFEKGISLFEIALGRDEESKETLDGLVVTNKKNISGHIHTSRPDRFFAIFDMYNILIGKSKQAQVTNQKKYVYRVERYSDAEEVYEPDDTVKDILPQYNDRLTAYEKAKKVASRADSGIIETDSGEDSNITEEIDNIVIDNITTVTMEDFKNVYIVSGEPKSGVSTMTSLLGLSGVEDKDRVIVVSLTNYNDVEYYLNMNGKMYDRLNIKDIVLGEEVEENFRLSVVSAGILSEENRYNALKYILKYFGKFGASTLIVECDKSQLFRVAEIVKYKLDRIVYTSENVKKEISRAYPTLIELNDEYNLILQLSNLTKTLDHMDRLDITEIKNKLPNTVRVSSPMILTDLETSHVLYRQLIKTNLWER